MITGKGWSLALAALLVLTAAAPAGAVTPSPAWNIESLALPTNFTPGDASGTAYYEVRATDFTGAALAGSPIVLSDTLPAGLTVKGVALPLFDPVSEVEKPGDILCETKVAGEVSTVSCKVPAKFEGIAFERETLTLRIQVAIPPSASGTLTNLAQVQGGGAIAASTSSHNPASTEAASPGLVEFHTELTGPNGLPDGQAGSHPYQYTTSFALNTELGLDGLPIPAGGDLRDIRVTLPPGLVGDPTATSLCTPQEFNEVTQLSGRIVVNNCPDGSVVGLIDVLAENIRSVDPIYSMVPPPGMPAQFGFQVANAPFFIDTSVGPGPEYAIAAHLRNVSEVKRAVAGRVTIWGVPGDKSHDRLRGGHCLSVFGASLDSCPAGVSVRAFLRAPTSCANLLTGSMLFDTWTHPGIQLGDTATMPARENCAPLAFSPAITAVPHSTVADSPSGLFVDLHLPQGDDPGLLATADLRDATVTLPEGVSINPASAGGLSGCSPGQVDLTGSEPAQCPDASKVGTVEVNTPLLDHPLKGAVYVASQVDNPFHSLIAIYIAVDDPQSGVVLKLAGKISLDPVTGRVSSTFTENPQLPFEDLVVNFFNGPRAPLRTPPVCGTYTTTTDLRPWSGPYSGPDATPLSSFTIGSGPGGPCPSRKLAPELSAGTTIPVAGALSPFILRLSREDGSGEFTAVTATAPPGLTARLKGIPYCSQASISQAISRGNSGGGAVELVSPSCPADSQVGSTTTGAGPGPSPFYTAGKVYLAGPYKGAPLSMLVVIPAVAGPFDLGVVVDRIALHVDPATAQVSAEGDPFPTILAGIPLDVRDIRVNLDRPDFTLNPTSCKPMAVNATVFGRSGDSAAVSDRFQVGGCKGLKFGPRLSINLKGGTTRGSHPTLRAELQMKGGEANIGRVSVALPHSEFLAQEHIRTICTRVQFAAEACPAGSIYGHARAFTPLLDKPLEGPVYLRSSSNPLPDLVAALHGQIDVDLAGRIDSVNGGIRNTFDIVPDAPVSKFVLEMKGGKKGLLVNSRSLCGHTNRAVVKMDGQNGKLHDFKPPVTDSCRGKKKSKRWSNHKQQHQH